MPDEPTPAGAPRALRFCVWRVQGQGLLIPRGRRRRKQTPLGLWGWRDFAALDLGLMAPLRVWVLEVDADASGVRVVAGDYDDVTLGSVMGSQLFLDAALRLRYAPANRHAPALVTCRTCAQARQLARFFERHQPARAPRVGLILGDTKTDQSLDSVWSLCRFPRAARDVDGCELERARLRAAWRRSPPADGQAAELDAAELDAARAGLRAATGRELEPPSDPESILIQR